MIRFEDIHKRFGSVVVLDGVNLEIPTGCITGLIGAGGAGKSVLLKILCCLVRADQGRVLVEGQDIHTLQPAALAELRSRIGVQFQNFALFDFMTVADNVAFPLRQQGNLTESQIGDQVCRRLADVGLAAAASKLPSQLSGGMKRRLAVARASITHPSIAIYDDPSAGLDPVTSCQIFELIGRLQEADGSTVLIASHDIERLETVCHGVALLDTGSIRFHGTFAQARKSPYPLLAQYLNAPILEGNGLHAPFERQLAHGDQG